MVATESYLIDFYEYGLHNGIIGAYQSTNMKDINTYYFNLF